MPNTFTKIASATVTGSASDIQFTNIPQIYTDLCIELSVAGRLTSGAVGAVVVYTATGQSSSLSNWKDLRGDGSSVTSAGSAYPIIGEVEYLSTNTFSSIRLYLPNYTLTTKKMFASESVTESNVTSATSSMNALMIDYTTPVSFLGFGDGSAGGGLKVGSTVWLYGIKNS